MGLLETARKSVKDDGKGNPHELQKGALHAKQKQRPTRLAGDALLLLSSCSKLTDTIDLAGVLYIFATILCALSGRIPKSHRSRSQLRSLFGLWHTSPK